MKFFPSELSGIVPVLLGDVATIVCKTHSSVVAVYPSLDGQKISPKSEREGIDVSPSTDNTSCNPDTGRVSLTVSITGSMWLNWSILISCNPDTGRVSLTVSITGPMWLNRASSPAVLSQSPTLGCVVAASQYTWLPVSKKCETYSQEG